MAIAVFILAIGLGAAVFMMRFFIALCAERHNGPCHVVRIWLDEHFAELSARASLGVDFSAPYQRQNADHPEPHLAPQTMLVTGKRA